MTAEHEFGKYKTQGEWDEVVLANATDFSVFFPNVGRWEFKSLPDAVLFVMSMDALLPKESRGLALLYAVTKAGRSTVIPREKWSDLLQGKKTKKKPAKLPCEICGKPAGTVLMGGRAVHASCWRTERLK